MKLYIQVNVKILGAPMGIEPASPAFRAGVLTTTPQHPGTNYAKYACSNHPWRKAGSAMAIQFGSLYYGNRNLISTMLQHIVWGWHMATTYGVQCRVHLYSAHSLLSFPLDIVRGVTQGQHHLIRSIPFPEQACT